MTPTQFQRVRDIFHRACELDESGRAAFLDEACNGDDSLRSKVLSLLKHDTDEERHWGSTTLPLGRQILDRVSRMDEPVPQRVGRYTIVRRIGAGGMGEVYEAEQDNPRRTVAVKVIRAGLSASGLRRRFEYEAQILGRLQHPGIAQIYDAGTAPVTLADGTSVTRPFFAMEYIDGQPLDRFAKSHQLTVRQRLELIVRVCDAVQHAHQKGVIHRDLKPANILVSRDCELRNADSGLPSTPTGGDQSAIRNPQSATPKVLDFGVARLTSADLAVSTMQTGAGQLIGTLPYMSPEQVSGDPDRVDTRSDVYALGVILFELLAGRLPYELSRRSLPDAVRAICDEQPTRLLLDGDRSDDDLDAIIGRALEKKADRRYQSVAQLASDVEAYLAGRPVAARQASAFYVLRKFARRHKRLVGMAAAATAAVVLGGAGTAWQAVRATRERNRAQLEARKAERVNNFLQSMLSLADPNRTGGQDVTVRDLLDRSALRVRDELSAEPELEAAVRMTMGESYRALGRYAEAESHLREALRIRRELYGREHVDVAQSMYLLASVLRDAAKYGEAFELCQSALDLHGRLVGQRSLAFANNLTLMADLFHTNRSDYFEAEAAYRQAVAVFSELYGPKSESKAAILGNFGGLLYTMFRYAEAEQVLREAYDMAREIYGPDHRVTIMNANNLALLLSNRRRDAEAEPIARAALDSVLRVYGPEHPESARLEFLVAQLLASRESFSEAVPLARRAFEVRRKTLAANHPMVAHAAVLLAEVLAGLGTRDAAEESEQLARLALQIWGGRDETDNWLYAEAESVLGSALTVLGRYDEAEALLLPSYDKIRAARGPRSREVRSALKRNIRLYEAADRPEFAELLSATLDSLPKP